MSPLMGRVTVDPSRTEIRVTRLTGLSALSLDRGNESVGGHNHGAVLVDLDPYDR